MFLFCSDCVITNNGNEEESLFRESKSLNRGKWKSWSLICTAICCVLVKQQQNVSNV